MGAHKTNPVAIMAATLPALVPPGHRVGIDIQPRVVPKTNIVPVPPDNLRTTAEGKTEVRTTAGVSIDHEEWQELPEGMEAWPLGKTLPPEKCDVALMVATVVEDMAGPRVLVTPGQQPRGKASMMVVTELARVPLVEWQAGHLGALRGEGE